MKGKGFFLHPLLKDFKDDAKVTEKYGKQYLQLMEKSGLGDILELKINILTKIFQSIICDEIDCNSCDSCNLPFKEKRISEIVRNQNDKIIELINNGYNNSYSIFKRGEVFQYIFDKLFNKDDNIIVFEIGCSSGLLGTYLTNSNHFNSYIETELGTIEKNNRFVQYYGIDPNLITSMKGLLTMLKGDTKEILYEREMIRKIYGDKEIRKENIFLEKLILSNNTIEYIFKKIKELYLNINNKKNIKIVIMTSCMRYYFSDIQSNDIFEDLLKKLTNRLDTLGNIDTHYFANEAFGDKGFYPSQDDNYLGFKVVEEIIIKGKSSKYKILLDLGKQTTIGKDAKYYI